MGSSAIAKARPLLASRKSGRRDDPERNSRKCARPGQGRSRRMPIRYEIDGPVATLTLVGDDESNLLTRAMLRDVSRRLVEFDDDPRLRVAIVRGAGAHHFSRGAAL